MLTDLPSRWYAEADELTRYGPDRAAEALRRAAQELEREIREHDDEPLTLEQAAALSGYSTDHLSRQVREARIPNAGTKGKPRIRRADLPAKGRALRTVP